MQFNTRNIFHLRISDSHVIPLYVYLDERHLGWMNETILQHVLEDLRPNVIPKLKEDAVASSSKKPTVDTHRGDTYQFCYFTRKVEPHTAIVKNRRHIVVNQARPQKRKKPAAKPAQNKRRRQRQADDSDQDMSASDDDDNNNNSHLEAEEEEEDKPKPILRLAYQSYPLSVSICVVVEPWPPIRYHSRAPSVAPLGNQLRAPSAAPSAAVHQEASTSRLTREPTPLFLPEDDSRATPTPTGLRSSTVPPVPVFNPETDDWDQQQEQEADDPGGMMELSQVLSNAPYRVGAVGFDEDDMDGDEVLFADADERRSL